MSVKILSFFRRAFLAARYQLSVTTFPQLFTASAFLLVFGLFTIMQTVVAGSGLAAGGRNADPFKVYAAIMPGKPSDGLSRYACLLANVTPVTLELMFDCQQEPNTQQALWLRGVGVGNGRILYVTFEFEGFRLGDLARRWGPPDSVIRSHRVCLATWRSGKYAALSPCSPSLFLSQVYRVTIGSG